MTMIKRMFVFILFLTTIMSNTSAVTTTTTTSTPLITATQSTATGEGSAAGVGVGAGSGASQVASNRNIVGNITDINASIKLYDMRIIQLQIHWTDNLPNVTTYNVIVNAENSTKCPDPPCHLYGVHKPKEFVLMPDNPIISVDPLECNYMFGCNYSVTVETSNTLVARQQKLSVPYCIANDTCSCQIRPQPPKVSTEASFPNNATVELSWSLQLSEAQNEKGQKQIKLSNLQLYKMHLTISELSNPLLSWGGKLIPILKETYPLRSLKYTELRHGVQGVFRIPLVKRVAENATLNIHAYIIDNFGCPGEPNVTRVVVPANVPSKYSSRLITLIIVSLLLLCAALAIVWLRKSKRQRRKLKSRREELYLKSFARPMIEMEDNINYVDKYVEQSQALGLADVFEVPHSAIAIGPEIGEGAFGRVFKATAVNLRRMRGTTIVAVKQLKRNPNADEIAEFLSEIEMLKGVGTHHNIVCFLGCCTIRAPYLMVMEFVGRGNLLSYLRTVRQEATKFNSKNVNYTSCRPAPPTKESVKYIELKVSTETLDTTGSESGRRQPKPSFADTTYTIVEDDDEPFEYILDNKELHNFALQIANGMRFLEEQEITHRDLAARNVLIDERKTLKISDFGLSRHGVYTNTKTRKLPLRWLSIEAIRDNVYSSKSDVWAYGVVLWEIGTLGASPYPTISNNELIPFLLEGKRLEKPEICTEQVYAIMLQCWTANPNQRPTFDALYKTLSPKTSYVDINKISDDYVFPPIKESNHINY